MADEAPMADSPTDENIYAVVLAGGSGTRFWPASRRHLPKQLLPLGPAAPKTLIRATVDRLTPVLPADNILVSTGIHLVQQTRSELPELSPEAFLAEPLARNTAPCIGWAAARIAARDPRAVVCVVPSDQYATDVVEYGRALRRAAEVAKTGRIVTIGVVPTRAETGYGYLQAGAELSNGVRETVRFVEKPDAATARSYLESGDYLWNAGMFIFRAGDMLEALRRHLPDMAAPLQRIGQSAAGSAQEAELVREFFENCESVSIDYGVMEKEANQAVVPARFGWSDLGSWQSAWELSDKDAAGNVVPAGAILVDCRDNLIVDRRSDGAPDSVVALIGVQGMCVVQTDDALLVLPRERSQDVRQVVGNLRASGRDHKT